MLIAQWASTKWTDNCLFNNFANKGRLLTRLRFLKIKSRPAFLSIWWIYNNLVHIIFWQKRETVQLSFRLEEFNMKSINLDVVNISFDQFNFLLERILILMEICWKTMHGSCFYCSTLIFKICLDIAWRTNPVEKGISCNTCIVTLFWWYIDKSFN